MEIKFLYFLLSLLLLLLASRFYHLILSSRKKLPPGPPGFPILGHLHLLKPPMHRGLYRLSQKYGPIISLRFGSRLVVVVSSSSLVEDCFTKNDVVLANRPHLLMGKHLGYNNTTMEHSHYGDHWRNLRRIASMEIFSTHRINVFLSFRREEIRRLLVNLSHYSLQGFAKVELKSLFQELTFNVTMRMVAGKRYYGDDVSDEEEAKQFREIIREAFSYFGASNPGDFLPIWSWIEGGDFKKRVVSLAKRTDKFLQRLVNERRSSNKLDDKNTMIDHLLSLQESHPNYYTDEIIKGFILVMLLGGTQTSAVTLEWALSNLLNHPNTLRKARDELDKQVGQDQLLDEPDLSKLPYLHNIISETLRLYPALPLLLPHQASESCTIGGYNVPRDTILLVNAWATHRDPTIWDDATSFKPERFENGKEQEAHKLLPFGMGRRSCPGAGLAQRMVGLTLGSLIQCFEWENISGEEIDMTEEGKGLSMPKAKPLEAMCKARPIMSNVMPKNFQVK